MLFMLNSAKVFACEILITVGARNRKLQQHLRLPTSLSHKAFANGSDSLHCGGKESEGDGCFRGKRNFRIEHSRCIARNVFCDSCTDGVFNKRRRHLYQIPALVTRLQAQRFCRLEREREKTE